MKNLSKILKIAAAVIAIAGVVYVVVAYGDKIVAWVKRRLGRGTCECVCGDDCENCDCTCEDCECQCEEHTAEEDDFQS